MSDIFSTFFYSTLIQQEMENPDVGWYFAPIHVLQCMLNVKRVLSVLHWWVSGRINVSWFGKYNVFSIFHDTAFPTYPENHDTKEGFSFLNGGTETKFFLAVKVKNDFHMIRIWFLFKLLCCCCLYIRFFSLILIGASFCNSSQLYAGPILESKSMRAIFHKKGKKGQNI